MALRASIIGLFLLAAQGGVGPWVQEGTAPESRIKAAFLYHFTQYVDWPTDRFKAEDDPFAIAILGRDPFGEELDRAVKDKSVKTHPIQVRRSDSLKDLDSCPLLFLSRSESRKWPEIRKALAGKAVLTIGEWENFAATGGAIGFFVEENKVRFEINPEAAERHGLKVSSRLLKLARIVKPSEPTK